ncbi:hypothetical protein KUL25_14985 [Rhodobacteraceae bacterium N5(2021)]|uniref:Uncharacterized protein n=1 Tax=Gymnodinialimonas phycosphaerae TaxID=2841589 RepID=A0A975TT88_9RHOB|nr:hypothetical protein [Gymnodinialimonas phycosphaerae]MBY4894062.1 hypothetical protein [Gymnodinialimonas phycosphaerae]
MSGSDKQLARLQDIAGALADRALQPVVAASAAVQRIEDRIAEIAHHRAQLTASTGDPSIAGTMLGQAERLRVKQAAAMTELAAARVALEKARRAAAKAVGRDQALGEMVEKRKAAAKLEARRRLLR